MRYTDYLTGFWLSPSVSAKVLGLIMRSRVDTLGDNQNAFINHISILIVNLYNKNDSSSVNNQ